MGDEKEILLDIKNQIQNSVPGEPIILLDKKFQILNNQKYINKQKFQTTVEENLENFKTKKTNILSFSEFLAEKKILTRGNNPCWPGYRQVGLKKKNGRSVPNCVPVKN